LQGADTGPERPRPGPVHGVQPFGDPCHRAVLEAGGRPALAHAPKPRIELPEGSSLGTDGRLDHGEQTGGERGVGLEAEEHMPAAGPRRDEVRLRGAWRGAAHGPDLQSQNRETVGKQPSIGRLRELCYRITPRSLIICIIIPLE
jgi:hypothetical protein